jgi:hypothetical protein
MPEELDECGGEMRRNQVAIMVLAAVFVIGIGAVVFAGQSTTTDTVTIKMTRGDAEQQVTVDVNGVAETVRLEDLADGEERVVGSGDHVLTVRRNGDQLEVLRNGEPIDGGHRMIWTDHGGESHDLGDGQHKVFVVATADGSAHTWVADEDVDFHSVDEDLPEDVRLKIEELQSSLASGEEGSPRTMVVRTGDAPIFVSRSAAGDRVVYRCADSGSELIVKKSDALLDSYVDPVTGCLMERVETPNIEVVTKIETIVED